MSPAPSAIMEASKILAMRVEGDALWRISLNAPKSNILDSEMIAELTQVFRAAADEPRLKAVLLTAEGSHFSFGASVEEHRPEEVRAMLTGFHELFRAINAAGVPLIAATRGCCLGGGLELVAYCQRIIAHSEAGFGQPEITLGVFAPIASLILADRVGRGAASDLLLTGRMVKAEEAREMRLIDEISDEPEATAMSWIHDHLMPRSASSLRFATRAARLELTQRFEREIVELERMYLEELMATHDAKEGVAAFLEKRKPNWINS